MRVAQQRRSCRKCSCAAGARGGFRESFMREGGHGGTKCVRL